MTRLPLPLFLLLTVTLGLAGAWCAVRLRRRSPEIDLDTALQRAPRLWLILPAIGALAGVQMALWAYPDSQWALPLWLEYGYTAMIWGGIVAIFSFAFALTVALAFATRHPRRWSLAIVAVTLVGAIEVLQLGYTRPIAGELEHSELDGVILQTSGASCVSASGANLLRLHGIAATELEVARALDASVTGASAAQLVYGLRAFGLDCRRVHVEARDLRALEPPAVLFFDTTGWTSSDGGQVPHAVTYAERRGDAVVVYDPLVGRRHLPVDRANALWGGRAVTCAAP